MATRSPYSLDPMAFIRGQEAARNANWQDYSRSQQSYKMALDREQWIDQMDDLRFNREAQSYTAPLITNLQRAADAGVNSSDYLIQQREQVMADPAFQSMAPEVQMRVLDSLGNAARLRIQDLQRTGQFDDVARLTAAYNIVDPVMDIDRAGQAGGIEAILATRGLTADADGMVDIGGTRVPAAIAALGLARSQGQFAGILPDVVRYIQEAEQRKRDQELLEQLQGLYGGGQVPNTDAANAPPPAANAVPNEAGSEVDQLVANTFGLTTTRPTTLEETLTQPTPNPAGVAATELSEADIALIVQRLVEQYTPSAANPPAVTVTPSASLPSGPAGVLDIAEVIRRLTPQGGGR